MTERAHRAPRQRVVRRALLAVATLCLGVLVWLYLTPPLPHALLPGHTAEEFGVTPYVSMHDADGDGIDDQTDVLASARAYVETRPVYGSAYYAGGYPDDGRGVCTDVVAAALRGAGYDLQALVDADIRLAPDAYDVETPDPNIDFRRVRNLRVWFARHAISLTCDTSDLDAWQGGDVVCYRDHVGIVSDRRDRRGAPYVIHHWGRLQPCFEEDCLSCFGEIVGHWRVS